MDVSFLPTDNLYKFMAIFGLVIIVTAYTILWKLREKNWEARLETQAGLRQLEARYPDADPSAQVGQRVAKPASESERLANDFHDLSDRIQAVTESSGRRKKQATGLKWWMGFGTVLMTVGFVLWYVQVQRYEDLKLRLSVSPSTLPTENLEN